MNVPMVKIGDFMLVTIQSDLNDRDATKFKDDLANEVNKKNIKGIIIDISCLEIVDSFIGRIFGSIVSISKLLGTETVIVGIKPAVAITIIELGLEFKNINTAINVEKGIDYLKKIVSERR